MWHIGIDLHKHSLTLAAIDDDGQAQKPIKICCLETEKILASVRKLQPFRAVIEASACYRWLYKLLQPHGTVLLANPLRLRAMVQRRSKTDKLDALLLAQLLRIDQLPLSYIPSEEYQFLREVTRYRVNVVRSLTEIKIGLQALLWRHNRRSPYRNVWCKRGLAWFTLQDFGPADSFVRDDLLERYRSLSLQVAGVTERLEALSSSYPQLSSILDIPGVGVFTGLLVIAELGDVERFSHAGQVGAYAGLTARVNQSGGHCYHGHISKQGSSWLRWILLQAAMKIVRQDRQLHNLSQRIRKRSSAKIARVAVARKLAEICWIRLRRWHRQQQGLAA